MSSGKGHFILGVTSNAAVLGKDTMLSPLLMAFAAAIPLRPEESVIRSFIHVMAFAAAIPLRPQDSFIPSFISQPSEA